jgi:hypothetical protein
MFFIPFSKNNPGLVEGAMEQQPKRLMCRVAGAHLKEAAYVSVDV